MWRACCNVFDYLNLAAVRPSQILRVDLIYGRTDYRWDDTVRPRRTLSGHSIAGPDTDSVARAGDTPRRRILRYECSASPHSSYMRPFFFLSLLDLMWSDPDDIDNWAVSPRGAGWLFGSSVTREVCHRRHHHMSRWHLTLVLPISPWAATVQSRKFTDAHRARAPAGSGRLQVHVQRPTRHRLVCPKLLLSVRERSIDIDAG